MVYAYLFAAVVGAILMGVSLLSGQGEHDHDGDGLADASAGDAADGEGLSGAGLLLSVRTWTYLLTFSGLSGLALRFVARVPEPWAGVMALGAGAAAAALAQTLIRRAADSQGSRPLDTRTLVGRSGRVLVPFGQRSTGKIRVYVPNGAVDVLATTDDPTLGPSDEVLIVEMREGATAHVTRSPLRQEAPGGGKPAV